MACIAIGAWKNNLDYAIATMSSRALHSSDLIKHQPSNKSRRLCGASPIQEQFHPQCYLDTTWMPHSIPMVSSHSPSSRKTRGQARLDPGHSRQSMQANAGMSRATSWFIPSPMTSRQDPGPLPSQSVCQYRIIAGCMPLLTTEDSGEDTGHLS